MSFRTIFWAVFIGFIVFGLYRAFHTDYSDPNVVVDRYLSNWQANNTTGMFPLLSQRARNELKRENVNSNSDYYAYFVDKRNDLSGYEIVTSDIRGDAGRYWVRLKLQDELGRGIPRDATIYLVWEQDGWHIDGYQYAGQTYLP